MASIKALCIIFVDPFRQVQKLSINVVGSIRNQCWGARAGRRAFLGGAGSGKIFYRDPEMVNLFRGSQS
jgi:hypothetical protein